MQSPRWRSVLMTKARAGTGCWTRRHCRIATLEVAERENTATTTDSAHKAEVQINDSVWHHRNWTQKELGVLSAGCSENKWNIQTKAQVPNGLRDILTSVSWLTIWLRVGTWSSSVSASSPRASPGSSTPSSTLDTGSTTDESTTSISTDSALTSPQSISTAACDKWTGACA